MVTHSSILLIEDSPGECELFRLALTQTGLDVVLYTEHDVEAALHFLNDRYHQSSNQARSYPPQEDGLNWSPAARIEQPVLLRGGSAITGDQPGYSPSLPSLILLDLQLHGQNGYDFLRRLRSDVRLAHFPVIVFTTSDDPRDLAPCYANGANGYVVKPSTFDDLVRFVDDVCRYWLKWNRTLSMVETKC
jgi:CheY-like chemotaxis protein